MTSNAQISPSSMNTGFRCSKESDCKCGLCSQNPLILEHAKGTDGSGSAFVTKDGAGSDFVARDGAGSVFADDDYVLVGK